MQNLLDVVAVEHSEFLSRKPQRNTDWSFVMAVSLWSAIKIVSPVNDRKMMTAQCLRNMNVSAVDSE